jgi:hypothetical protein
MDNNKEFFGSASSDKYKNQADVWYKVYNISREKTELFHDFLLSLYELVDSTYLGSDILISEQDQKNHFTWCWKKTISIFEKERIFFRENGEHYYYYWNMFLEAYYFNQLEGEEIKISNYIMSLFSYDFKKNRSELTIMTEMYKLLEQNLKTN